MPPRGGTHTPPVPRCYRHHRRGHCRHCWTSKAVAEFLGRRSGRGSARCHECSSSVARQSVPAKHRRRAQPDTLEASAQRCYRVAHLAFLSRSRRSACSGCRGEDLGRRRGGAPQRGGRATVARWALERRENIWVNFLRRFDLRGITAPIGVTCSIGRRLPVRLFLAILFTLSLLYFGGVTTVPLRWKERALRNARASLGACVKPLTAT